MYTEKIYESRLLVAYKIAERKTKAGHDTFQIPINVHVVSDAVTNAYVHRNKDTDTHTHKQTLTHTHRCTDIFRHTLQIWTDLLTGSRQSEIESLTEIYRHLMQK